MAAREFLSLQVVNVTEADVETAIEATQKGQGLTIIPFGKQLLFIEYVDA